MFEDEYGQEDLWDDVEEFERDQLAEDYAADLDEDHEEWADEFEPAEDFGHFGEMGLWD